MLENFITDTFYRRIEARVGGGKNKGIERTDEFITFTHL